MIIMQQLIIIMEGSKALFCSSKFSWAHNRTSSKFDYLVTPSQKVSPAMAYSFEVVHTNTPSNKVLHLPLLSRLWKLTNPILHISVSNDMAALKIMA